MSGTNEGVGGDGADVAAAAAGAGAAATTAAAVAAETAAAAAADESTEGVVIIGSMPRPGTVPRPPAVDEKALAEGWKPVPIAAMAAAIPLYYCLTEHTKKSKARCNLYVGVRFLGHPSFGGMAPPALQYGGANGPMPPLILARGDGRRFSAEEWAVLDNFLYQNDDWYEDTRSRFRSYLHGELEFGNGELDLDAFAFIELM